MNIHSDKNNNGAEDAGENIKSKRLKNNVKFGFNPGILDFEGNLVTSAISVMFLDSNLSPSKAEIGIGTDCADSSLFLAVTTTSSKIDDSSSAE